MSSQRENRTLFELNYALEKLYIQKNMTEIVMAKD